MVSLSVSAARAALPALLSRVAEGEEVTITRHGRPVAVLVHPDALRARRDSELFHEAARVHDLLEHARGAPLAAEALTPAFADDLIAGIRDSRDRS